MVSSTYSDQTNNEKVPPLVKAISTKMEFNRVNCLVWVLHESARSFSHTVESFKLARSRPELAMAWVAVDVHAWHKRIAHQVAVYALLRTAIELEFFLSHGRCNSPSLVREILSPMINSVKQNIESRLKTRHPKLVEWFRMVELPRIAGFFIPLLKKCSMEYAGSLVSVDKLYQLATEAGFEREFLYNFGTKIQLSQKSEDVEFWIGLAQKKLAKAIRRESVFSGLQTFQDKVQESNCLATLGIFAFLGRKTRLFFSGMGIKDLDEQVKDFLRAYLLVVWKTTGLPMIDQGTDFSSSQLQKITERNALDPTQSIGTKSTTSSSLTLEAQQKASCKVGTETRTLVEAGRTAESEALHQILLRKSSMKLISTSSLLFIDIMASLELLLKQMRGRRITERERKKLKQTLAGIASLIPVTTVMLLPVSVVGHAAILAAINKYMPSLVILVTLSLTFMVLSFLSANPVSLMILDIRSHLHIPPSD
uniref:Letm1 RBD domain-containing protein n=1 Tax=Vitis vinifera TaxID=29760 RepID=A5AVN1_VITVI|nr:hypothetical protein VITISV_007188 [Vitis vinifera]